MSIYLQKLEASFLDSFLYEIETRRKMFHWFIDGWGYHITPDNKFNMFPNHGITWDMYDRLTPEFITEHYNVDLL